MTDWHRIDDPENPPPRDGTEIYVLWDLREHGDDWMRGVVHFDGIDWRDGKVQCCEPDFWLPTDALPPLPVTP